jgi:hypothetical protein
MSQLLTETPRWRLLWSDCQSTQPPRRLYICKASYYTTNDCCCTRKSPVQLRRRCTLCLCRTRGPSDQKSECSRRFSTIPGILIKEWWTRVSICQQSNMDTNLSWTVHSETKFPAIVDYSETAVEALLEKTVCSGSVPGNNLSQSTRTNPCKLHCVCRSWTWHSRPSVAAWDQLHLIRGLHTCSTVAWSIWNSCASHAVLPYSVSWCNIHGYDRLLIYFLWHFCCRICPLPRKWEEFRSHGGECQQEIERNTLDWQWNEMLKEMQIKLGECHVQGHLRAGCPKLVLNN